MSGEEPKIFATTANGDACGCGHDHGAHHAHHHDSVATPTVPVDTTALVSARGLVFRRSGRTLIDHIDLDVRPGEIVTLIGPNGAGKTTLVKLILGILQADGGTVHRRADCRIGYVPQRFEVDSALPMTVGRFLALGLKVRDADVSAALSEVGVAHVAGQQVSSLSGGETQRVLIARALLRQPTLMVLDEPARGVDYVGEADLYDLISRLRDDRGLGILLVSHDLHVVMAKSDRVICINQHVCCSGQPEAVAQHPEYARLFGPKAAGALAVYTHRHDHAHDISGATVAPVTDATGTQHGEAE